MCGRCEKCGSLLSIVDSECLRKVMITCGNCPHINTLMVEKKFSESALST